MSGAFQRPVADMQMLMAGSKANPLLAHRALNTVIRKYGDITKFAKAYGKESNTPHTKVLKDVHDAFASKLVKQKKMDAGGPVDPYDSPGMGQFGEAGGGSSGLQGLNPRDMMQASNGSTSNKLWMIASALRTQEHQPERFNMKPMRYEGTNDYTMKGGGPALRPRYASGDQVDDDPSSSKVPDYRVNWPMFGLTVGANMMAGRHASWSRNLGEGLVAGAQNIGDQQKLDLERTQQAAQQQYYKARALDMQGQAATRFMDAQRQVGVLGQNYAMMADDPTFAPGEVAAVKQQLDDQTRILNQLRPQMTGQGKGALSPPPVPQAADPGGALGGPPGGGMGGAPPAPSIQDQINAPPNNTMTPPTGALSPPQGPNANGVDINKMIPTASITDSGPSAGGGVPPARPIPPPTNIPQAPPAATQSSNPQEMSSQQWKHIQNVIRLGKQPGSAYQAQSELYSAAEKAANESGVFVNPGNGQSYTVPGFGAAKAANALPLQQQTSAIAVGQHGAEKAIDVKQAINQQMQETAPGGPKAREAAIQTNAINSRAAYQAGLNLDTNLHPVKDINGNEGMATGREILASKGTPNTTNVPSPDTDPVKDGIVTDHGTVLPPPPPSQGYSGLGTSTGPSATRESSLKSWREEADKDYEAIPSMTEAQQRVLTIGKAFQQIKTGYGTTTLATINAMMRKVGLPDITGDDPGQVQIGLKSAFGEVLDTMKEAHMSRPAFAQVKMATENFAHPDLQALANGSILAQTYGVLDHLKQSTLDFRDASKMPGKNKWEDPDDFRAQWMQKNPLQGYIDNAHKLMGPLKGEQEQQTHAPPAGMPVRTPNASAEPQATPQAAPPQPAPPISGASQPQQQALPPADQRIPGKTTHTTPNGTFLWMGNGWLKQR